MAGRKIVSYTGGSLADPNRPEFSWWDYIMNRMQRRDTPFRGENPIMRQAARPPADLNIFTDEFYARIAALVPLQQGYFPPTLTRDVVPVIDVSGQLSPGGLAESSVFSSHFPMRSKLFQIMVLVSDLIPAGINPSVLQIFNPIGSGKTLQVMFQSWDLSGGQVAWRRYNIILTTLIPKRPLNMVDPTKFSVCQLRNEIMTVADINNQINGMSPILAIGSKGTGQFSPTSPSFMSLGQLEPGRGVIGYPIDLNIIPQGDETPGIVIVYEF